MKEFEKLIGINRLQLLCFFQVQYCSHNQLIDQTIIDSLILLFGLTAEGTTTNGDYLLTFKTGAFLAGTPVLPVILKYPYERFSVAWDTISGVSISYEKIAVFSKVSAYKKQLLFSRVTRIMFLVFQARHILFLLCQFVNHLEVIRLPVYYPSQEEKDDPKLYASNVRRLMATEVFAFPTAVRLDLYIYFWLINVWLCFSFCCFQGNLILSDLGLGDKRIYHATLNGNLSQTRDFHQKEE